MDFSTEDDSVNIGIIIGAVIGGCCIILVLIVPVVVVLRIKHNNKKKKKYAERGQSTPNEYTKELNKMRLLRNSSFYNEVM